METDLNSPDISFASDIMIDIETLGDGDNALITSVGAVAFDITTGGIVAKFHKYLDINKSLSDGFKITSGTLKFWVKQDVETFKNQILTPGEDPEQVMHDFKKFVKDNGGMFSQIWGRGPSFDLIRIKQYCNYYNIVNPWNFRLERCVRTMEMLRPDLKDEFDKRRNSVLHNGLEDAIHQARYVSCIYQNILGINV